jgi:RNA polymerase sigma-70 factor (ECF subfamily)
MEPSMKQGEEAAQDRPGDVFWDLLAGHEKKLYNYLRRALGFSEDSADLFQEVVLRAWRYFPSFDHARSFPAWLFAIAHNEVRTYYRRRRAERRVVSLDSLASAPAAPAPDPDAALVLDAASRLPLRQREVFFLFYCDRFSVAEIAAICRLREGNVKFILSRGREAVRQALEARDEKR